MGMFDTIHCSYDLGPGWIGRSLQTKDLDCFMDEYWLSPSGQLYLIDYRDSADFIELKEGDEGYEEKRKYLNFQWKPNGKHGRVKITNTHARIIVYPSNWDVKYAPYPDMQLTFTNGKLTHYESYDYDSRR